VARCKHCGDTKGDLDARRVDGKLPPCPDAPVESLGSTVPASVAGADRIGAVFYCADMKTIGSKRVKGVRAEVYSVASKFGGFYYNSKEQSIFYSGDDLVIKILFESLRECAQFTNELDSRLRYFPLLSEVSINRSFDTVIPTSQPTSILQRDYVSFEEDSEAFSIAITRYTHVTAKTTIDFETELMMIENSSHEDFYGLKCYKCHLMSQADFPEERDNPNNALWMSWPTHQRFDGLHTVNEHRVPQFAISFGGRSGEKQMFDFAERERVDITVECVDDGILGVLRNRMKSGSVVDETEKRIFTSVFVQDAVDFERCLTYKYNETKFMWTKRVRGELVTEAEAHNLRRSARIQANKETLTKASQKK
jgi:hypothetical protein